jgi:hypothetical protein
MELNCSEMQCPLEGCSVQRLSMTRQYVVPKVFTQDTTSPVPPQEDEDEDDDEEDDDEAAAGA